MKFSQVPREQWRFAKGFPASRRHHLQESPTYEEIVDGVLKAFEIERVFAETPNAKNLHSITARKAGVRRVVIRLKSDAWWIDLFHNSSGGYRAQFWHSVVLGETANQFIINKLMPAARSLMDQGPLSHRVESIREASLKPAEMKVWIHQGLWCRFRRLDDRVLEVPRWHENRESDDKRAKKLATYASLAPDNETLLELIGKWVYPGGNEWCPEKGKKRSLEIHQYGFT